MSNSRMNATTHGLFVQPHLMSPEERAQFDAFCIPYIADLRPSGPVERQFAEVIARESYRINKMHARESALFTLTRCKVADTGPWRPAQTVRKAIARAVAKMLGRSPDQPQPDAASIHDALDDAQACKDLTHDLNLISLYLQRSNREVQRNLKQLRELQQERRERRELELAEAALAASRAERDGKPFDPVEHASERSLILTGASTGPTPSPNPDFVFSNEEIRSFARHRDNLREARKLFELQKGPRKAA